MGLMLFQRFIMFSYRHAFHAGNHADVLKHVVLLEILRHACRKETAVYYIDTHAGAGLYDLSRAEARKNREFDSGIGKLWKKNDLPPELHDYLNMIRELNPDGALRWYPGSPGIAEIALRSQDRLRLFELHSTENRLLLANVERFRKEARAAGRENAVRGRRMMIEKKDGFAALKGQLPPPSRRAVVLMDPPYEDKRDYRHVLDALADAVNRFATGTYMVWFPELQRQEARRFPAQLKRLPVDEWLEVALIVSQPAPDGFGLCGSRVFIVNPPWQLKASLESLMPRLTALLGQDDAARFEITSGVTSAVKNKDNE
jgi:23S rRNA (adenine2030-N6)-methyltransferase